MYEYMKNTLKEIAHEALNVKMKKNYRTNWMTAEVLESMNLEKETFDKWLSSKQDVHK
jgi:hypothetical protein